MTWLFWGPAPIPTYLGPPATCHLISVQKTVLTREIPGVSGAVCQKLGQRPNLSLLYLTGKAWQATEHSRGRAEVLRNSLLGR